MNDSRGVGGGRTRILELARLGREQVQSAPGLVKVGQESSSATDRMGRVVLLANNFRFWHATSQVYASRYGCGSWVVYHRPNLPTESHFGEEFNRPFAFDSILTHSEHLR